MTDPPVIADVALSSRAASGCLSSSSAGRLPGDAVALKAAENPYSLGCSALVRFYLRRADRIVAICETMRARLVEKGANPERVTVIPNWTDVSAITAMPKDNPWAAQQGPADRFVVMHSGNIGHAQNLDALIRSASFLRDLERMELVVIGTGARHASLVELAERLELDRVRFLDYQPREVLSQSLSTGDIHVVGLARGLAGYVVPSRLYGILAAGRPVVVAAEPESETAQVVERVGCGVVVEPGRPELLADVLRDAYDASSTWGDGPARPQPPRRRTRDRRRRYRRSCERPPAVLGPPEAAALRGGQARRCSSRRSPSAAGRTVAPRARAARIDGSALAGRPCRAEFTAMPSAAFPRASSTSAGLRLCPQLCYGRPGDSCRPWTHRTGEARYWSRLPAVGGPGAIDRPRSAGRASSSCARRLLRPG